MDNTCYPPLSEEQERLEMLHLEHQYRLAQEELLWLAQEEGENHD